MQKKIHRFPSVEYLETFLENNQMFVIGSSARTCSSQTLVHFHDHNISLQARHIETPKKNIQFNLILNFRSDNQLFNILAVGESKFEFNSIKTFSELTINA